MAHPSTAADVEKAPYGEEKIPYLKLMLDQGYITPRILNHPYSGSGTEEDPYIVEWIPDDPRNPMLVSDVRKWLWILVEALALMMVAMTTSAYSAAPKETIPDLHMSREIFELGLSVFIIGFALGPLFWAPLSEMYGRQILFFITYGLVVVFTAGCAAAPNAPGLVIMRYLAGTFGSSPLTNSGGVIADIFPASQRGLGMIAFSTAPFFGPILGPISGGFVGQTLGWRWVSGVQSILLGVMFLVVIVIVPETYAPVLLDLRARRLSKMTGEFYVSKGTKKNSRKSLPTALEIALTRPWILLFREPIVLLLSTYMAILYGTLYLFFAGFPIVYQETRGWSEGMGGLAFLGICVGIIMGVAYSLWDNQRYAKLAEATKSAGKDPDPEIRLPPCMLGAVAIPVSMFWWAWTNGRSVHWIVSIVAQIPFGYGFVLVYLSVLTYLVDSYTIFAASVLAANTLLRSAFGAVFPLFTGYMYENLGIHWASSVPGFLALACVPFPFLFYKYGERIRARCKYAAEAERYLQELKAKTDT